MYDLKIFANTIDPKAVNQIYTLAKNPAFADAKIRIMPDVHPGKGCTIGFTADLGEKVIPNIVGSDIGCGMLCASLKESHIDFAKLDQVIRTYVPSGHNVHPDIHAYPPIDQLYCKNHLKNRLNIDKSLGTLGGGNHFIEVDKNMAQTYFLIIHTGSRNLGKQVADIYQQLAIQDCQETNKTSYQKEKQLLIERYQKEGKSHQIQDALTQLSAPAKIPTELSYLTGKHRQQYLHDMKICQDFANANRRTILNTICNQIHWQKPQDIFQTIHNYIDMDSNIVRKGAISAKKGEQLLIPINMRDGCILGIGKGNPDWNQSAPHGAGRICSRNIAKETLSMDEYRQTMSDIYTTSVCPSTLDESPMAYKSIDEIVDAIEDTVEIIDILQPVYNFKASE